MRFIGDMPLFVSLDSADVWVHPELFELDRQGDVLAVAGVPPDTFSPQGQLWGTPVYHWEASGDRFCVVEARLRATLALVDGVRFDHFRGLEACWSIPAGSPTAATGQWVPGPGAELLHALKASLGGLPVWPEDLGFITPEVDALRTRCHLPSMRILQFAFGGHRDDRHLPDHFDRNIAVYTGTHDNDTMRGWFGSLSRRDRHKVRRYVPATEVNIAWDLIRLAWASVADLAIAPLQDVLGLGSEAPERARIGQRMLAVIHAGDGSRRKVRRALALPRAVPQYSEIRVLDVAKKTLLPESLYPTGGVLSWMPDGHTFLYEATNETDIRSPSIQLNWHTNLHKLGTVVVMSDKVIFGNVADPEVGLTPKAFADVACR